MALKDNAKVWAIREQIIEDPVSGLTLQFEVMPDGERKIRVFGTSLPYGNREFSFNQDGNEVGAGTYIGHCRPTWMEEV